jgi:uncharacterized protein (UPF0218 family)
MDLVLPKSLRPALKTPFGVLVPDLKKAGKLLSSDYIISVGDKVSDALLKMGVEPAVCIFDGKTRRDEIGVSPAIKKYAARGMRVKNPPGTITTEAQKALEEAIKSGEKTKIMVEGEEDLLTLVAVSLAPENALVIYGQPDAGAVIIKVGEKTRKKIDKILEEMKSK